MTAFARRVTHAKLGHQHTCLTTLPGLLLVVLLAPTALLGLSHCREKLLQPITVRHTTMCSVQRIIGTRNSNKHATDAVVHDPVKPVFILDCASFYKSFPCLNDPLPLLWGQAQVNHFLNWAVGSKLWLKYIKNFDKAYPFVARQS